MDVFTFENYREFLAATLAQRRRQEASFSQSAFARELGLAPNRLSEILAEKQGLSRPLAAKIARRLKLKRAESAYFCGLVGKTDGRSQREREDSALDLEKLSRKARYRALDNDQFWMISDWYPLAIVELAKLPGFVPKANYLAAKLGITEEQARTALARLEKIGLLRWKADGWELTEQDTRQQGEIPSRAIRHFHEQILSLAAKAQSAQTVSEKEFSSVILSVADRQIPMVKKRIQEFVLALDAELAQERDKDQVYCFSTQFFRLTKKEPSCAV